MIQNRKIKIAIISILFLAIAAGVFFTVMKISSEKKSNVIKILPDEADVRIQDFIFTEVGRNNVKWEVRAKMAQYQKKINIATFDKVQITLTTQQGKVYIMTGDEGKMQTETKDVELKGHVVVISDSGDKFSTDYLCYSDAQKKVYTDAPVMMANEKMKIQGVGLSIFVDKGELLLASKVNARIY